MIANKINPWHPRLLWLLIPAALGSTAWWWAVSQIFQGRVPLNQSGWALGLSVLATSLVGMSFWLGSLGLLAYLSESRWVRGFLTFLTTMPIAFFFPFGLWWGVAIAMTLVGVWWGIEQAADDSRERLNVKPRQSLGQAASLAITGILLAVSALYYQQLRGGIADTQTLANHLVDQSVTITEKILPLVYHGYNANQTVDQFLGTQIPDASTLLDQINFSTLPSAQAQAALNAKLEELGLDPKSLNLSAQNNQALLAQQLNQALASFRQNTIAQARQKLSDQLGLTLRGDEPLHQVIVALMNQRFSNYVRRYAQIIPPLLALGIFLLLKALSGIFQLGYVAFGLGLYHLFRFLGIVTIETETLPAQRLRWHH
ncbi:MAG: hypothetical protein HY092_03275 [Candidatus Kerfeldbacteria bacterium]|nr:hypothetical protein [Candidatus Kerfeldbacteria bacterium]